MTTITVWVLLVFNPNIQHGEIGLYMDAVFLTEASCEVMANRDNAMFAASGAVGTVVCQEQQVQK
jgi:hypothetical protein